MKKRVLIIEDNDQNRYLFSLLLKNSNYAVEEAVNGRDGIDAAIRLQPDLILLDIQLPDIDGYEVARSLRKTDSLIDTPIIAVTSYAMTGDREKSIDAGCSGYIEKPINPESFITQIEKFLPGNR